MRILAVDVGTTSVKAGLVDDNGIGAVDEQPLALATPAPGRAEQDADEWWTATRRAIARLSTDGVDAIAVTGQMQDLIAVGGGRVLRPAILYSDQRAIEEHAELAAEFGAAWSAVALAPPDATNVAAKWEWMRRHEARVVADTEVVLLGGAAVVVWRLTGRATSDPTTATTTGLFDARVGEWWSPIVDRIALRGPSSSTNSTSSSGSAACSSSRASSVAMRAARMRRSPASSGMDRSVHGVPARQ